MRIKKMYIWAVVYVLVTYLNPVFLWLLTPKGELSDSNSIMKLVVFLPWVIFFIIPIILLMISILVAVLYRNEERKAFLAATRIMKYSLIPYFIAGGILIGIFSLMPAAFPLGIIISVPMVIALSVMGWVSMVGSAPFMVLYLVKSTTINGSAFSIFMMIMQVFFGLDVLATIICGIKEIARKLKTRNKT